MKSTTEPNYWQITELSKMTDCQWEGLCDGCARCCLNKLEDWDTGEIYWTNVACELLDCETCRCKDYENRQISMPDCILLTQDKISELSWLPPTCAYRLVSESQDLPGWHPLISGRAESVHEAGVSVRGRAVPENNIKPEQLEDHIVDWPREIIMEIVGQG
ncbi:MAG: YcgN family cysteine cluster protein [Hyphomicrobiales bacterium]|nr:YcgN family cysteine cluster protein [Hyphomicrobiales bacterium]